MYSVFTNCVGTKISAKTRPCWQTCGLTGFLPLTSYQPKFYALRHIVTNKNLVTESLQNNDNIQKLILCLVSSFGFISLMRLQPNVTILSLAYSGTGTALKYKLKWYTRYSHVFYILYIHLYWLRFHAQHCCHLPVGKVTNKIKESLQSKELYQEDGIK